MLISFFFVTVGYHAQLHDVDIFAEVTVNLIAETGSDLQNFTLTP